MNNNVNLYFYLNGLVVRFKNALTNKTGVVLEDFLDELTGFLDKNDDLGQEDKEQLKNRYMLQLSIVEEEYDLAKRTLLSDWQKELRFEALSEAYHELALTFNEGFPEEYRLQLKNQLISLDYHLEAIKLSAAPTPAMILSVANQFSHLSLTFESFGRRDYLKSIHCLQHAIEAYELLLHMAILPTDKAEHELKLSRLYRTLAILHREALGLFPARTDISVRDVEAHYRKAYQYEQKALQCRTIHVAIKDRMSIEEENVRAFIERTRSTESFDIICKILEQPVKKTFSMEAMSRALVDYSREASLVRENSNPYEGPGVFRAAFILDVEAQYPSENPDTLIKLKKLAETIARPEWLEAIELLNLGRTPLNLDSKQEAREANFASKLMELFDAFRHGVLYVLREYNVEVPFINPDVQIDVQYVTTTQQAILTSISKVIGDLYTGKLQLIEEDRTYYRAFSKCAQSFNRWFNGIHFWESIYDMQRALSVAVPDLKYLSMHHMNNMQYNVFNLMSEEDLMKWVDNFSKIQPDNFLKTPKLMNFVRKNRLNTDQFLELCVRVDEIVSVLAAEVKGRGGRFDADIRTRTLAKVYEEVRIRDGAAGLFMKGQLGMPIQTA